VHYTLLMQNILQGMESKIGQLGVCFKLAGQMKCKTCAMWFAPLH